MNVDDSVLSHPAAKMRRTVTHVSDVECHPCSGSHRGREGSEKGVSNDAACIESVGAGG